MSSLKKCLSDNNTTKTREIFHLYFDFIVSHILNTVKEIYLQIDYRYTEFIDIAAAECIIIITRIVGGRLSEKKTVLRNITLVL